MHPELVNQCLGGIVRPLAPAQVGLANPPALPQGLQQQKAHLSIGAGMSSASLCAGFACQTLHLCCGAPHWHSY